MAPPGDPMTAQIARLRSLDRLASEPERLTVGEREPVIGLARHLLLGRQTRLGVRLRV
jgi:hypothetical protein